MEVRCWSSHHTAIIIAGALGSIILVLGLFLFLFLLLRQNFSEVETKKQFGFLFQKYKEKHRRCEIFTEFQKVLLVAVKVMISENFQPGKNFVLLVLLGLIMIIHGKVEAFMTIKLNRLNLFSFIVLYVTLVIELMFSEVQSILLKYAMGLLSLCLNAFFIIVLFIEYRREYILFYAHSKIKLKCMCVCKADKVRSLQQKHEEMRNKKSKLSNKLYPVNQRLKTIIKHYENNDATSVIEGEELELVKVLQTPRTQIQQTENVEPQTMEEIEIKIREESKESSITSNQIAHREQEALVQYQQNTLSEWSVQITPFEPEGNQPLTQRINNRGNDMKQSQAQNRLNLESVHLTRPSTLFKEYQRNHESSKKLNPFDGSTERIWREQ